MAATYHSRPRLKPSPKEKNSYLACGRDGPLLPPNKSFRRAPESLLSASQGWGRKEIRSRRQKKLPTGVTTVGREANPVRSVWTFIERWVKICMDGGALLAYSENVPPPVNLFKNCVFREIGSRPLMSLHVKKQESWAGHYPNKASKPALNHTPAFLPTPVCAEPAFPLLPACVCGACLPTHGFPPPIDF